MTTNWTDTERAYQAVLDRAGYYTPITGADADFLKILLQRDPKVDEIIGCGLDHFTVVPQGPHGNILSIRCQTLVVHRIDGKQKYWHPAVRSIRDWTGEYE
jgi:hypothetical protein